MKRVTMTSAIAYVRGCLEESLRRLEEMQADGVTTIHESIFNMVIDLAIEAAPELERVPEEDSLDT